MTKKKDTAENASSGKKQESPIANQEASGEVLTAVVEALQKNNPDVRQLLQSRGGKEAIDTISMVAISIAQERNMPGTLSARQLNEFNTPLDRGAERMFALIEREQAHRHEMEKGVLALRTSEQQSKMTHQQSDMALRANSLDLIEARERRGQYLGGALAFGVLVLGTYLTYLGHPGTGAAIVGSTMAAIAAVFVIRRAPKKSGKTQPEELSDAEKIESPNNAESN